MENQSREVDFVLSFSEVQYRMGKMKTGSKHGCRIVCTALFFLAAVPLAAQDTFSIYWENDSRFTKPNGNTDRHYTNGLKLVLTAQPDWQWLEDVGDWQGQSQAEEVQKAVGFFLGQNIYTPNHPEDPSKRKDKERVFAGWLYGGMFVQRRQKDIFDHAELNIGVVGPSAKADTVQRCIHTLLNSGNPVGWEDQLDDEPAADFTWVRKQRQTQGLLAPTDYTDVITDFGFTAGSLHRHLEAGIMLRCGANLPNDFGPGRLSLPNSAAGIDSHNTRSTYLFARLSGRAVEHDRFLTGLTPRPLVGRGEIGVVCRWNDFEVTYAQPFMTEEFKEQSFTDSFGAFTLTWMF
jgi:hypothetical protein